MKDISYIADVVEFRTWAKQQAYDTSTITKDLKAAIDPEEYSENIPEDIFAEIQERQQILADAYPFEFDGDNLRFRGSSRSTYLFCLGLSLLPPALIEQDQRCEQFESVAAAAASAFFNGSAMRIGAPWRTEDTPDYSTLLDRVVAMLPDLGKRLREAAPDGGDGGWDVLVVKNFADMKFPRFVALGNCATGRTDWKRKGREREPRFFWSFFTHDHRSTFITFFVVPFVMDEDWRLSKSSESQITFDRFRVCEHAPESSDGTAAWLDTTREAALAVAFN
jgi:hypothetical protein